MINTEDAISGEYTRDKTICQHSAFQDRVLTVGNIEHDFLCAGFFQSCGSMGKCPAARADIVHDQNISAVDFLRLCQLQPLNLAGAPVTMFNAKNILHRKKLRVSFGSTFIRVALTIH